jgi:hypothetical protein
MRKYLIIGVSLFLLALISLNTSAITASQIGANQIVNTINNSTDWAGVAYSVEWWTDGIFNHWGPVLSASDYIYTGNLSLAYVSQPGYNYPDEVAIWVGLSPAKIGYDYGASSGEEETSFVQAGYIIGITSSDSYYILYFVFTIDNGNILNDYETYVPAVAGVTHLDVSLTNLENGTAVAQFFVVYSNGATWTTKVYESIPWTQTGAAMSIVEAPLYLSKGVNYELPYLSGGMINFNFEYIGQDGNEHVGPSTNPSGTIYADVYQLGSASNDNIAYAQIYNGWANSYGGWDYLYQFTYPGLGTTYGL